jgi:class 3 adenylate cyclase
MDIKQKIAESKIKRAIIFVDLCNSTELKQNKEDLDWLTDVVLFINVLTANVEKHKGNVIKRIGDEIMATFSDVSNSEYFINDILSDKILQRYDFKIGVDYGEVFNLQFETNTDDPYGTIVDRCARITGLIKGSLLFASDSYVKALSSNNNYTYLDEFPLKGISQKTKIWYRELTDIIPDSYYSSLLDALNAESPRNGYKAVSRVFESTYFKNYNFEHPQSHPFLFLKMLNIPKANISIQELDNLIKIDESKKNKYLGYIFKSGGYYNNYQLMGFPGDSQRSILLGMTLNQQKQNPFIFLSLPYFYLEVIEKFSLGDFISFSGVFTKYELGYSFDYVEIL